MPTDKCAYCGGRHDHVCPRVRSLEYEQGHTDQVLRRVEFHESFADYPPATLPFERPELKAFDPGTMHGGD